MANANDIKKIRVEIADLLANFRRPVSYWDIPEIMHTPKLVAELFGIIDGWNWSRVSLELNY